MQLSPRARALRALAWSLPLWVAAACVTWWTVREVSLYFSALAWSRALGLHP